MTRLVPLTLVYLNLAVVPLVAGPAVAGVVGYAVLTGGSVDAGIALAVVNVVTTVGACDRELLGLSFSVQLELIISFITEP